jgi:hypothetical protein
MADKNYLQAIPLTTYDTSGLSGSYAAMNGSGTENRLKILKLFNASDTDVTISYDNSTDHDFIQSGATLIIDCQANNDRASHGGGSWHIAKSQIIYGKGSAGTGNLYIIGYY